MKIEFHVLQNFPPSCLNRDDTNSPKDCEFGGVRRARISSQSIKRAAREYFRKSASIPEEALTVRTKRLVDFVTEELARLSRNGPEVPAIIELLLQVGGLALKKEDTDRKTEYLLYLPRQNLIDLAILANESWDELTRAIAQTSKEAEPVASNASKKPTRKKEKSDAKENAIQAVGKELGVKVKALLFGSRHAPELALFGRMLADAPNHNVDAACQVAHAISTHRVSMEFDFFTAVDDLKPNDNQGADMMGTTQFNSACFYRYSVLDVPQFARTLAGTETLTEDDLRRTRAAVLAWADATINAVPSARQNGMAAWTRPSVVLCATRTKGLPLSLANAFAKPVRPGQSGDLIEESARALSSHLDDLLRMYGDEGMTRRHAAERQTVNFSGSTAMTVPGLLEAIGKDLDTWKPGAA